VSRWFLLLVFLVNLGVTVLQFPPAEIPGPAPIVNDDFPKLHYYADLFRKFSSERGLGIAYDPRFFAGYETNLGYATCALYLAVGAGLPWVSTAALVKGLCFLGMLFLPVLCAVAGLLWSGSAWSALAAGVIGIILTHLSNHYNLIWVGNVNSVVSLVCVPVAAGFLMRLLTGTVAWRWALALGSVGSLALLIHPLFPVFLAPMLAVVLAGYGRGITGRRLALAVAGLGGMVLSNLFWLVPFLRAHVRFRFGEFADHVDVMAAAAGVEYDFPLLTWYANIVHIGLVLLALAGGVVLLRRRPREFWILVSALGLYGLMFVFRNYYMWLWQARICVMMDLMLVLLAAGGLPLWIRTSVRRPGRAAGVCRVRGLGPAVYGCLAGLVLWGAWEIGLSWNAHGRVPPFSCTPVPQQREVIEWLRANVRPGARVLFEDIYFTPPFGHRIAPLAVGTTGFEFIGGPSTNNQVSIYRIEFHVGMLAWSPVQTWARDALEAFLRTYNIGWVLAHSTEAVETFARYPELFRRTETVGGYRTYRIDQPAGYFQKGRGKVRASTNRIDLHGLEPEDGEVVLRYHYLDGMKADPPVPLEPVKVPGDPQPFLRLVRPPAEVTILFP